MRRFSRVFCIVLDGVGAGEAPDAAGYGDTGSNSLANTARHVGALRLPVMQEMGLGCVADIDGVPAVSRAGAWHGRMRPAAAGKDSTSGHWELMGCVLENPFPTYPGGFPGEVITEFERAIGRRVLSNRPASGTEIIAQLGEEHLRTGRPIVYTSQDSVFQIAAHEDVIPRRDLYRYCEIARKILAGPHAVGRVIARPFAGEAGGFYRTAHRRDFSLPPPRPSVLDALTASGHHVLTIGKIHELFAGRGVTESVATRDNRDGMEATLAAADTERASFVFVNLVDFDTMWGHRNDPRAYALGLEEFDSFLPTLRGRLEADTLLIVTSDHGNDPTLASTDHSREYVPLLVWHGGMSGGGDLGTRETLADVAATVADNFGLAGTYAGTSFLRDLERPTDG